MSVIGSNVLAGASGGAGAGFKIERSLRFNSSDSARLDKNFASAGNRQTWTWSGWVKRSSFGSRQHVFGAVSSGSSFGAFEFNADDELRFYDNTLGDSNAIVFETGRVFRDPSAWYHIVVALDSTAGTDATRIKLYVNGVQETSFSTGPTVASNGEGLTNSNNVAHNIGSWTPASSSLNLKAYLAEIHFIDGQALDQYSFGEFDDNGVWQPIKFTPSTEYSTSAITSVTALNTSFTTNAGTANAFGSGNIDEGTFDRKTNGAVLDVTLSPAQSGNFVVYTGAINETSNYTIVFEYSDGTTQTVLNNSTSTRNGPGNTCTVNVGQKSNVVGFTVDCQDINDSQLCGVTVDGTKLVTNQAYGKQVTLTDGTNLDQFPVDTVVSNGDKVTARDTTNNTLTLDGTSWAAGQYVTKGGYGTNGFHLDFSDTSSTTSGSNAGIGKDASGKGNYLDSTNIDPVLTNNGINIDVTSTPFTDIGSGITVTNPNQGTAVSTTTAATNSFNLTTVADVGAAGTFKVGPTTIPTNYTIDYYFRTSANQPNNAKAIYSRNSGDNFAPVDDWTNGTTSTQRRVRLHDGSSHTDYSYTVTDDAWNHVRITKTNIWVNGTSITSSPKNIGGIAVREFELGGDSGYEIDGEIGPFRMVAKDLGAPPAGGLVANSDGTLPNESAPNPDTDSFVDTPTNYEADSGNNGGNYCSWNPLHPTFATTSFSNGNLDSSLRFTNGSNLPYAVGTFAVSSGKWYWEITLTQESSDTEYIGFIDGSKSGGAWVFADIGAYFSDARKAVGTSPSSYGATYTTGDVIGVALDADNGSLTFYKNGTTQGVAATGMTFASYKPFTSANGTTTAQLVSANFGQRSFQYTPPAGYKSLCTTNLVDPTIADGSTAFDTKTWAGNNSSTNSTPRNVDTYKFSPDLVWIKNINSTEPHNIYDTLRGEGKYLYPHDTNQENDAGNYGLTGFLDNGFSLLDQGPSSWSVNADTRTYVGWAWDGGDLVTNSAYDQSQTWSSGTSTNPSQGSWANVFVNSFSTSWADGTDAWVHNASATLNFSPALPTGAIQVYATASGAGATDCYVSFSDGTNTYTTGNLSGVNHGWVDVASGSSLSGITSVTINSGPSSNEGLSLKAIKVAGKELVDAGLIPAGSLNSSLYNQDQIWSTYGTFTGSYFNGIYTWDNVFSADMGYGSTGALYVAAGGTLAKWVLTSSLTCNSEFKFYCYNNTTITLNEGLSDEVTSTSSGGQSFHYHTIPFSGQIHSVKMASTVTFLIRLFVDGKALIDSDVTMPNVPSIASTVRANPEIGFSIMTLTFPAYTGSSSVAHGLNAEPHWWMMKDLDSADSWYVGHRSIGAGNYLKLDLPTAPHTSTTLWDNQLPDSNFIYNNATAMNDSGRYVMYVWAPVEGYSKFGMYNGDSSNYPFVFTGFRPALIITKRTDTNGGWVLWDTKRNPSNVATEELYPDDPSDEYTGGGIDILSNGFKLRNNSAHENTSGGSYIYIAFAEHPFKTARAR